MKTPPPKPPKGWELIHDGSEALRRMPDFAMSWDGYKWVAFVMNASSTNHAFNLRLRGGGLEVMDYHHYPIAMRTRGLESDAYKDVYNE